MSCRLIGHTSLGAVVAGVLNSGSAVRLRVVGKSMRPTIQDGDLIEVRPFKPEALRIGDVVLFRASEARLLAHRIVQISDRQGNIESIMTKGDTFQEPDPRITPSQVLGRVVLICRHSEWYTFEEWDRQPVNRLQRVAVCLSRGIKRKLRGLIGYLKLQALAEL